MPRRRGAEEFAPLLEIPAVVELELIADAQKSARQREPRVRRQTLLPAVEVFEAAAAGDVPELIAPAQLAAGIQAPARLRIDRRDLLEAVTADVRRLEITADAGLHATRIGLVAQAGAQSPHVELAQISVLPQDQAAVGNPPALGVPGQAVGRGGQRFDESVALVADPDRRRVRRQRRVAVVAAGQGDHGARLRRGRRAAQPLEGRRRESAQVRVRGRAVRLSEVFHRLLRATRALRGQAEVVAGEGGPLGIGRERLELALGLFVAAQPVIRCSEVVVQTRSVQARPKRIEERLKRRWVVARAERGDAALGSQLAVRGGADRLPRNGNQE